jgi:hypothetical protein
MGLLDDTTQQQYYQGNDYGNYQFTSLDDVINQFIVAYVGEDKIISKIKRTDVAFHAQRAMQELSFDTFKSCKAQEITVPASLQMKLPHDYVNYTRVLWVDSAGIKHPIYPTKHTQNPFSIKQDVDGTYLFSTASGLLANSDFSEPLGPPWQDMNTLSDPGIPADPSIYSPLNSSFGLSAMMGQDTIGIVNGALSFKHYLLVCSGTGAGCSNDKSRLNNKFQEIDVSQIDRLELTATGTTAAATASGGGTLGNWSGVKGGWLRIGLISSNPTSYDCTPATLNCWTQWWYSQYPPVFTQNQLNPPWLQTLSGNDASLEWLIGQSGVTQSLSGTEAIDVSAYNKVWVLITSAVEWTDSIGGYGGTNSSGVVVDSYSQEAAINSIDNIILNNPNPLSNNLQTTTPGSSTTWSNYKSGTPSENQDDTYWPLDGSRFGLDPQHAQANGSFYIDCHSGKIHFSSNISGKTVVLDYISDSLGTDGEMQVHKFAEEAMYKWIAHAILATRANTQEYLVQRFKKERFAAVRTAKLRLSNIKLEEITQILRGKSKQIKH